MKNKQFAKNLILEIIAIVTLGMVMGSMLLWLSNQKDAREDMKEALPFDLFEDVHSVSTVVNLGGERKVVEGFYMEADDRWGIVMPEAFDRDAIELILEDSFGNREAASVDLEENVGVVDYDGVKINVGVVSNESVPTMYITTYGNGGYDYLISDKNHVKKGNAILIDTDGSQRQIVLNEVKGHGNDSWGEEKKSFSIECELEEAPFGMDADYKFNLICGFRDNSLPVYMFTRDMYKELHWDYAPEYRVVNLYIDGQYLGLYFLTEKMTISKGTFDLKNLNENIAKLDWYVRNQYEHKERSLDNGGELVYFELPSDSDDVTGGYLLELDPSDYDDMQSRFVTSRGIHTTLKSNYYASKAQVEYIYNLFQDFEDAVYSPDGYNDKGIYYADYIDMQSFADQWLMYEFAMESDVIASIYFYKEADDRGDGKLHAVWPWDVEHSFKGEKGDRLDREWLLGTDEYREKINFDFWAQLYTHEDFVEELRSEWVERFHPMIDILLSDEEIHHEDGLSSFTWYYNRWTEPFVINNFRWPGCNMSRKIDGVREAVIRRAAYMDGYLLD